MTKDKVVKILNDNSQKSVIGWAIEEDDFNEVAEKIVKLCNLQNVSNQRELLIAFYYHMDEWRHDDNGADFDDEIENWIKSNL